MNDKDPQQEMVHVIIQALKQETLTLDDALRFMDRGKEKALSLGVSMVIAVVDSGGNLIAQHRMDEALIGSIAISLSKAYTSAVLQSATDELAKSVLPGQPLYGLAETGANRFCVFGGGIPIMRKNRCIGGLGVSGGTVEQDMLVARYALEH